MKKLLGFLGNEIFLGTMIALLSVFTALASYLGAMSDSEQNKYEILGMQQLNDGNAEYIIIEFNVLVDNEAGNQNLTVFDNDFTVSINGATSGTSNTVYHRVVEPVLATTKNDNDPDGWAYGQTVTYTVQVAHVSGDPTPANNSAADAFDLVVTDTIPAGLTYVIAVERTGPISPMSATRRRNASALHTTASTIIATMTSTEGTTVGHAPVNITNGTYASAAPASETATMPTAGRSDIHRERIAGPRA